MSVTSTSIRHDMLSTKLCSWSHSSLKAWPKSCRFYGLASRESTAHCSSYHRCSIGLQYGESWWWCSIVTSSYSIKSRLFWHDGQGRYHLDKDNASKCLVSPGRQVFPQDIQIHHPNDIAIQDHQLGSSTSMKGTPTIHRATTSSYGMLYTIFMKGLSLQPAHPHSVIYAM